MIFLYVGVILYTSCVLGLRLFVLFDMHLITFF